MENYDTARQATHENIIRRARFSCCVTKATNTQSEYVILVSFPLKKSLHERASVLYYTYIACLVETSLSTFHARLNTKFSA